MPIVQSISYTNNKPFLRADNTGYAAIAGLGVTAATAMTKNKSVRKYHKPLAFITAGLALLHLGVIHHNRLEWKKNYQKN